VADEMAPRKTICRRGTQNGPSALRRFMPANAALFFAIAHSGCCDGVKETL
jgi:hypothetical protein